MTIWQADDNNAARNFSSVSEEKTLCSAAAITAARREADFCSIDVSAPYPGAVCVFPVDELQVVVLTSK